jgi:hypothetical protein
MPYIVAMQTRLHDPAAAAAACKRLVLAAPVRGTGRLHGGEVEGLVVQLPGWRFTAVIDVRTGAVRYDAFGGLWGDQKRSDG